MRTQKGYTFHRYDSWFVRYKDDVLEDGVVKRKLVCKKLEVPYSDKYHTKKSVKPFVDQILAPINNGSVDVRSTMPIADFVLQHYLPNYVEKELRPASRKQFKDTWKNHLKPRLGQHTLRSFRTVDAQQIFDSIAGQGTLGRSSMRHCKSALSGIFKEAKRLGILDGISPIQDTKVRHVAEREGDTYAYSLAEIKSMLALLPELAGTVVLTAAFSGLRRSEIMGLRWEDYDGRSLTVRRSIWNGIESKPKTRESQAPVPVIKLLADALDAHEEREGKLAQRGLPIFQAGNGSPLNIMNLARRVIRPSIELCVRCRKLPSEHKLEGHMFEPDASLAWRGWHAFRRGLATNLHALGVDDLTIQAILRHSDVSMTQRVYIKTVKKSQVDAMVALGENFETCNVLATSRLQ